MSRPTLEPVTANNLPAFAQFLHENLSSRRSAADWEVGLSHQWCASAGNQGFVVCDSERIVGGIGAYYSERMLAGRLERFCNITSWCVLDAYRAQSTRLAMAVIGQPGYHFTNFSPTSVVASTLKFLKFTEIDAGVTVFLNIPGLPTGNARVASSANEIESALRGDTLAAYRHHAVFPWLQHVLVGQPGHWCHVIYKRQRYKGMPAAAILYLSDHEVFSASVRSLSSHLLSRGMVSTHVETRFLGAAPRPSAVRSGFAPKLFLSPSLKAHDIDYLYSESVALDL
jgi:hypothetical protein